MLEEKDESRFKHTVTMMGLYQGVVFVLEVRTWGDVVLVVFKDKRLDEVTQGECGGEQSCSSFRVS